MALSNSRDIVVIGGSAGSLAAVRSVLGPLPADFPASIFCVRHIAPDSLPVNDWLQTKVLLNASTATDGTVPARGAAYFAPPNKHLLLEQQQMRVLRGPRENGLRPSIDVLFRSAAAEHRSRVIAILLSGTQSDGVNGLSAVKRCGGVTIVQEPKDASSSELPERALRDVGADHVLKADDIPELLAELCRARCGNAPKVPLDVLFELALRPRRWARRSS